MTEYEPIKVRVVEARLLTSEEKTLLEELKTRQQSSLNNLRAAFQHLITLSVSLIGLQMGILQFINFKLSSPQTVGSWLFLLSFGLLFSSAIISFIGQISGVLYLSTIDTLKQYQSYREARFKRTYPLYILANILFMGGLASFIIGFIVNP